MVRLSEIKAFSFSFGNTSKTKREKSPVTALLQKKTEQFRTLIGQSFSKKSKPTGMTALWVETAMKNSFHENLAGLTTIFRESPSETSSNSHSIRSSNPFDENYDPNYIAASMKSSASTSSLNPFEDNSDTEVVARRPSINPFDSDYVPEQPVTKSVQAAEKVLVTNYKSKPVLTTKQQAECKRVYELSFKTTVLKALRSTAEREVETQFAQFNKEFVVANAAINKKNDFQKMKELKEKLEIFLSVVLEKKGNSLDTKLVQEIGKLTAEATVLVESKKHPFAKVTMSPDDYRLAELLGMKI
jgi:hypothetical protein